MPAQLGHFRWSTHAGLPPRSVNTYRLFISMVEWNQNVRLKSACELMDQTGLNYTLFLLARLARRLYAISGLPYRRAQMEPLVQ